MTHNLEFISDISNLVEYVQVKADLNFQPFSILSSFVVSRRRRTALSGFCTELLCGVCRSELTEFVQSLQSFNIFDHIKLHMARSSSVVFCLTVSIISRNNFPILILAVCISGPTSSNYFLYVYSFWLANI